MNARGNITIVSVTSLLLHALFFFLVFTTSPVVSFCQDVDFLKLDTFYPDKHSGEAFGTSIREVRKDIIRSDRYGDIRQLDVYVDKLTEYTFENKFSLREAYARHAHSYKTILDASLRAEHYYLKAHQLLSKEELLDDGWVYHIENPLAVINNQLGDLEKSLYYYEITEDALRHQRKNKLSRLLSNKGILFQSMYKYKKARHTYLDGIFIAKKDNNNLGEALNRINLNSLNIIENKFFDSRLQLDTIEQLMSDEEVYSKINDSYLEQLAGIHVHRNNYDMAIVYYTKKLEWLDSIYPTHHRREYAKVYQKIAEVYLKLDDQKKTRQSIMNGLECLVPNNSILFLSEEKLYHENTFMDLYGTLGKCFARTFDTTNNRTYLDSALLAYDCALHVYELLASTYQNDESKYQIASANKSKINGVLDVIWKIDQTGTSLSTQHILDYLQKSKSLVFDEAIEQRMKYEELTSKDKNTYEKCIMARSDLITNFSISAAERIAKNLQLNQDIGTLVEHIQIDLSLVQSPYVNYVESDSFIYSFDNFHGNLSVHKLVNVHEFNQLQYKFLDLIINAGNVDSIREAAQVIYKILLAPLGNLPPTFSIIPDVYLGELPFDALVDKNGHWLIENHQIDYRISLKTIPKSNTNFDQIVCVRPDYGSVNNLIAYNRNDIYPLKYSQLEEKVIQKHFKNAKIRQTLDIDTLSTILSSADVLHYSGHARMTDLEGELILNQSGHSISGAEIAEQPSNLILAVLSACETGVGELKYGEGIVHMARSFLSGGTKNVINSLWTVNDQTTAFIMTRFYTYLIKSRDINHSLRLAKIDFLNEHEHGDLHPYYWSGFVLTTIDSGAQANQNSLGRLTLLLFIASIIGLFIFWKLKINST